MESCIAGLEQGGQAYLAGSVKQAPALSAPAAEVGLGDGQVHDLPVGRQLRLHQAPEVSAHPGVCAVQAPQSTHSRPSMVRDTR